MTLSTGPFTSRPTTKVKVLRDLTFVHADGDDDDRRAQNIDIAQKKPIGARRRSSTLAAFSRSIELTVNTDALRKVREGYDPWAAVYDHDQNPLTALEEPPVRRAVGEVRGLSVLDLGCGTGRHTAWLANAGARVTAVDFSEGMLREARRKLGTAVEFLTHDLGEPLPFADQTFDIVVSGLVLEHLRDLPGFFHGIRRVLRRGGRAVISAMHPDMFLRGSQARFTDPTSGELVRPGSRAYGLDELVTSARAAALRVDAVTHHAPDRHFAALFPRAEKYLGFPMLLVLELNAK